MKVKYEYEVTYLCPNDQGGAEYDEYGFVAHCPKCGRELDELKKPNYCSNCGCELEW